MNELYKFGKMTTEELTDAKEQIREAIDEKLDEKRYISERITALRKQYERACNILQSRKASPYNGEYYIKSDFRLRYEKPFRELSPAEKRKYHHEYWERCQKQKRKLKKKINNQN